MTEKARRAADWRARDGYFRWAPRDGAAEVLVVHVEKGRSMRQRMRLASLADLSNWSHLEIMRREVGDNDASRVLDGEVAPRLG